MNLILFGNIYIALGAFCLLQSTAIQLNLNNVTSYSLLVFFATLFIYNLQRIFYSPVKDVALLSVRRKWIFENQFALKMLTTIGFVGVAITFFFIDFKLVYYLFPLLVFSIAYFLPMIKLRKNPWYKLLTLVLVWTITTAVVPILLNNKEVFAPSNILHIVIRFCFMMAICIPFDLRDVAIDKQENVLTLPHLLGESKTRWIAVLFMLIYSVLVILECATKIISIPQLIALLVNMSFTLFLILLSSSKRNEYYFVAGIDGAMITQGILLIIVNLLV